MIVSGTGIDVCRLTTHISELTTRLMQSMQASLHSER